MQLQPVVLDGMVETGGTFCRHALVAEQERDIELSIWVRPSDYGLRSILATLISSRDSVTLSKKVVIASAMGRHSWIRFLEKRT